MLHVIQTLSDPLLKLIADDPVRPEITLENRVNRHAEVFVLLDSVSDQILPRAAAVVCVAYRAFIPSSVDELLTPVAVTPTAAIYYTIWSYLPGAGRRLIQQSRQWILTNRSEIRDFVTLSPATDVARRFHLQNGAAIYRVNTDSINYQYF